MGNKYEYAVKILLGELHYLKAGYTKSPIMVDVDEKFAESKIKELQSAIKLLEREGESNDKTK